MAQIAVVATKVFTVSIDSSSVLFCGNLKDLGGTHFGLGARVFHRLANLGEQMRFADALEKFAEAKCKNTENLEEHD